MSDPYKSSYTVGQNNIKKWGMDAHHPVFIISAIIVLFFVIGTLLFPENAKALFSSSKTWSISNFDDFFIISCNIFVIFSLALIFLPVGKIRLGGIDAKPEYSTLSWLSMLFAAGMGIGLMFWSVAEPVAYYTDWWAHH